MEAQLTELKNMIIVLTTKVSEIRQELKGLIEIQQKLIHVQLGAPIPPPPKEFSNEENTTKINITNNSNGGIKVSGKTYDYMSLIKDSGNAKFDKETKSWNLPITSLDSLVKKLQSAKLVNGKDFSVNVTVPEPTSDDVNMFD